MDRVSKWEFRSPVHPRPHRLPASILLGVLGDKGENKDPRRAEGDSPSLLLSSAVSLKLL